MQTLKSAPVPAPAVKPAATRSLDSAKAAPADKTAPGDSSKAKVQPIKPPSDDVWGVQAVDSSKTTTGKNTPSQASPVDTTVNKQAVDTTAALKPAQAVVNDKKTGKQSVKKEKPAKKPKEKTPPSPPVDEKNW
jgi:hypothetical protein